MIKYEACSGSYPTIERIEVTRETEKCVWIRVFGWEDESREEKRLKVNSWRPVFDTWEQAHNWIITKAIEKIEDAQRQLMYAEADYEKVKKMKENK
jgi:hypothetical protein